MHSDITETVTSGIWLDWQTSRADRTVSEERCEGISGKRRDHIYHHVSIRWKKDDVTYEADGHQLLIRIRGWPTLLIWCSGYPCAPPSSTSFRRSFSIYLFADDFTAGEYWFKSRRNNEIESWESERVRVMYLSSSTSTSFHSPTFFSSVFFSLSLSLSLTHTLSHSLSLPHPLSLLLSLSLFLSLSLMILFHCSFCF